MKATMLKGRRNVFSKLYCTSFIMRNNGYGFSVFEFMFTEPDTNEKVYERFPFSCGYT